MKKIISALLLLSLLTARGGDDLSHLNISDARMPIYNNGTLTMMAYSRTATRKGTDLILDEAILDIIKRGIGVDRIKYLDGTTPYPLDTPLSRVLAFWAGIIHSDGLIFTQTAVINQKTKNAHSPEKIYFRSPALDLNGVGFQANFALKTVKVLSDVTIKIRRNASGKELLGKTESGAGKTAVPTSSSTITADSLFIDFPNNLITITGNVKVDDADMTIDCDKIVIHLQRGKVEKGRASASKKSPGKALTKIGSSGSGKRISKIVCLGHVVITRKQPLAEIKLHGKQQAFADRADYDLNKSLIVLTGKEQPRIQRGSDLLSGQTITVWRDKEHLKAVGNCRLSFIAPGNKKEPNPVPTVATADYMDMDYAANLATLTDDVKVVDNRMTIDCDKMKLYFIARKKSIGKKKTAALAPGSGNKAISKIVCTGNVNIYRRGGKPEDGVQKAMADRAVYHLQEHKIVLTENSPTIIRGKDSVKGKTITIWTDQQKMHVDKESVIVLYQQNKGEPGATRSQINSDYTNIDYGRNIMSFSGRVKVTNPRLDLDCNKMLIFLKTAPGAKKNGPAASKDSTDPFAMRKSSKQVEKIICLGDVKAKDQRNTVTCQKLTLFLKPGKATPNSKNNHLNTGKQQISRIICQTDVVLVRQPAPATATPTSGKAMPGLLQKSSSTQPITVKTDLMDLKLNENYGELIGHVYVDESQALLQCDKMELYAKDKGAPKKIVHNADAEFDNEKIVADGGNIHSKPQTIAIGDNKELEKIICLKNVDISRKIMGTDKIVQRATGDRAVYFIDEGRIVMTENAAMHQGDETKLCDKITLWTDTGMVNIIERRPSGSPTAPK